MRNAGYIERALASWPKHGSNSPWRVYQNYIRDVISLKWTSVDNNALEFSNPPKASSNPRARKLSTTDVARECCPIMQNNGSHVPSE